MEKETAQDFSWAVNKSAVTKNYSARRLLRRTAKAPRASKAVPRKVTIEPPSGTFWCKSMSPLETEPTAWLNTSLIVKDTDGSAGTGPPKSVAEKPLGGLVNRCDVSRVV